MAPRHRAATAAPAAPDHPSADRTTAQRLGQAFREYIERYPADRTPYAGGVPAQITVTMTLADFATGCPGDADLGDRPTTTDTGVAMSTAQARRMACEAAIIPVVLDGAGQPLDVSRSRRFHTPAQRIAIALRDRTCTAEGCDWPPGMCHVHHDDPWSRGGATSVDRGRLLCPRHHAMAHHKKYRMKAAKNGRVIFSLT